MAESEKKKTKEVMLRIPPEVFEEWEALRKKIAPLTPMAVFLAEQTRTGIEETHRAREAGKKTNNQTEPAARVAGESK